MDELVDEADMTVVASTDEAVDLIRAIVVAGLPYG